MFINQQYLDVFHIEFSLALSYVVYENSCIWDQRIDWAKAYCAL